MKRMSVYLLAVVFGATPAFSHEPGTDSATVDLGNGKVTIHYGTPKLNGRNLDEMIKPGMAWRMGMNNATTIETTVALDFAGNRLQPGKYTLFARSDEKQNWTLLISSGTTAQLDPATVVVSAPLRFQKEAAVQEVLKITLERTASGASLLVAWGSYRLQGSLKAAA